MNAIVRHIRKALIVQFDLLSANRRGSVIVEFAIVANIVIAINILTFDFASYYRLSQQVKHAAQFIQTNLANDSDHIVTKKDLERQISFLNLVTNQADFNAAGAIIVMDVMPIYQPKAGNWVLLVCWSWSSNAALKPPPESGKPLSTDDYPAMPWVPTTGTSASSALVIVETVQTNSRLFDVSLVPATTKYKFIGPIRYSSGLTLNLNFYESSSGSSLNNSSIIEPSPSNAIACQR